MSKLVVQMQVLGKIGQNFHDVLQQTVSGGGLRSAA
jgi:hypothetical protein